MSGPLVIEDFAPHIGNTFKVAVGDAVLPIVLESAQPITPSVRPGGSFGLTFTGPMSPVLNQASYDVSCGDDAWYLFLVPLGPKDGAMIYEAIFN